MTLKPGFIQSLSALGPDVADRLLEALAQAPPETSIRINTAKGARIAPGLQPVPWCAEGYYLPARDAFTFDPALHQGLYYVQDASSMAIAAVAAHIAGLAAGEPLTWLDACAAPGGKTTAIASQLPQGSTLIANEFDTRRAAILAENTAKWGSPAIACVRGDAARFAAMPEAFDVVSADVPCSGEGMMRKDPEAAAQWSPELVADCARTQWRIVSALWRTLRPGGYFIYSTCTFNRTENEQITARMAAELGATGVEIPALRHPGIIGGIDTALPAYRFLPGHVRGEGLFLCVLRKPGSAAPAATQRAAARPARDTAPHPAAAWLGADYATHTAPDGTIRALPRHIARFMPEATGHIIATVKGRDIIPAQPLAMSTNLRPDAFPRADVDRLQALAYLRREAITIPDVPRGIVLLHHGGHPLGFVKNLGNRANNLYPQPWRILSTHTPAESPAIVV